MKNALGLAALVLWGWIIVSSIGGSGCSPDRDGDYHPACVGE